MRFPQPMQLNVWSNCSRPTKLKMRRKKRKKKWQSVPFCALLYTNVQSAKDVEDVFQQLAESQSSQYADFTNVGAAVGEASSSSSHKNDALTHSITILGGITRATRTQTLTGI